MPPIVIDSAVCRVDSKSERGEGRMKEKKVKRKASEEVSRLLGGMRAGWRIEVPSSSFCQAVKKEPEPGRIRWNVGILRMATWDANSA